MPNNNSNGPIPDAVESGEKLILDDAKYQKQKPQNDLVFLNFDALKSNNEKLKLANREIRHRVYMRWFSAMLALVVIVVVIFIMSLVLLGYLPHEEFWADLSSKKITNGAIIALIGVPIASVTAITVAFLIGAFRNHENKDLNDVDPNITTSIATGATKITGG